MRLFVLFAAAVLHGSSSGSKAGSCFAVVWLSSVQSLLAGLLGAQDVEDKRQNEVDSTYCIRLLASMPLLTFSAACSRSCSAATAPAASRLQLHMKESTNHIPVRLSRHECQHGRPIAHCADRSALLPRWQSHAKAVTSGKAMGFLSWAHGFKGENVTRALSA